MMHKEDSYRGIYFINVICKIFDYVILYICGHCFVISDM